jgi:hypothetical protein
MTVSARKVTITALLGPVVIAAIAACGSPDARADLRERGRVVDSILPREEAVRRFREGLPPVDSLEGAAGSRDELVAAFVRAIAEADTAAIASLALSRAEFAYLYYPTAVEAKPPYDLEPGLLWFTLYERSNEGARKALSRFGGQPMTLVGYDCGTERHREGENTIHGPCTVRWRNAAGDTASVRLFSKILERDGRFKFLSYANKLG